MIVHRVFLAVLLAGALAAPAAAQSGARMLVLPFENSGREARLVWLGEASAILLADGLNARGVSAITRAERVRAFEGLHLPVAASLSRATVIKVGQILGASEVIGGSYRLEGDDLVVEAHTITVEVGRLRPVAAERGPLTDLFAIFERLARRLSGGAGAGAGSAHPPLNAFENYVKGLLAESAAARATFLESAIRQFPAFDRARIALWDVRHEQGDHPAALAVVKPVTGDTLPARRAHLRAGVSLLEMGQYDEAAATFTRLLDPDILKTTEPPPAHLAPILNNLGLTQMRRGSDAGSGSPAYYLTRAADADPGDPDYQFNLGYAYAKERNYKAAMYWLREAVRRDVTDADAHYLLAITLDDLGNRIEASRERELAQQLSSKYEEAGRAGGGAGPPSVPSGLERVKTDLEGPGGGRPDQAIVSSAQREQRNLASFHLTRGRRLFENEQDRDAMLELRRAVYLSPYDASAHLLIGRIHLRAGRPGEAIEALKISLWSEDTAPARVTLAEAYLASKNPGAAKAELDRAIALDPDSADARRLLDTITK